MSDEDDAEARRARAETLRMRIDELRSGSTSSGRPSNPRDFVEERAREEAERERQQLEDAGGEGTRGESGGAREVGEGGPEVGEGGPGVGEPEER